VQLPVPAPQAEPQVMLSTASASGRIGPCPSAGTYPASDTASTPIHGATHFYLL